MNERYQLALAFAGLAVALALVALLALEVGKLETKVVALEKRIEQPK